MVAAGCACAAGRKNTAAREPSPSSGGSPSPGRAHATLVGTRAAFPKCSLTGARRRTAVDGAPTAFTRHSDASKRAPRYRSARCELGATTSPLFSRTYFFVFRCSGPDTSDSDHTGVLRSVWWCTFGSSLLSEWQLTVY